MNVFSLLDILEDELENGKPVPLLGKVMVDRDKCLDIIRDIRLNLPEALERAEMITRERQRILAEAQKEAETLLKEAEQHIKALVDEHEITQMAYQQSREIIENAQESAKKIRLGAREYADEILQEVERYLAQQLEVIKQNREELKGSKKRGVKEEQEVNR